MIHEYALDPALLNTWERVRYYIEKFGYDKRRLISKYPRRWKKMVWDSVQISGDVERKKVEVFLQHVDHVFIEKRREYDGELSWLNNAEREHGRLPFKAVLSSRNPSGNDFVVSDDEFTEDHPLLSFPVQESVKRTPIALAEFLTPILEGATKVLFIDPHFEPHPWTHIKPPRFRETRWNLPLIAFLGRLRKDCQVEYHALRKTKGGEARLPIGNDHVRSMESWAESCCVALPHVIPKGVNLTIFRWQERQDGRQFHARYIVTDQCAVSIDPGLDADWNMANEFADVICLNEANRHDLEARYAQDAIVYDLLSRHEVVGIGDCVPRRL